LKNPLSNREKVRVGDKLWESFIGWLYKLVPDTFMKILADFERLLSLATRMAPQDFWSQLHVLLERALAGSGRNNADEDLIEQTRIMLSRLVELNENQIDELICPDGVKLLVHREFQRIRQCASNGDSEYFNLADYKLLADFQIACFARLPVGVEHIEIGGLPRSLLFRGDFRQACQVLRIFWSAGFRPPYYVSHLAQTIIPFRFSLDYSLEARLATYRNIAACLEMNPRIRGLIGGSWWFDPKIRTISPRLPDFAKIMLDNGAVLLRYGKSPSALHNALYNSPVRQKLYNEKKYTPQDYFVVWLRDPLIAWARRG
jgi:hypothetical protein